MWRNWAGDQRCSPAAIERPASVGDLAATIARARDAGAGGPRGLRVAGSGHSFTDIALTDGTLVLLDRMRRVLDVDATSGLVRVEAGITLRELGPVLDRHGLGLTNLGDFDRQTVAGAISTGTHGTGMDFPNVSAQVEALEIVLADGTLRTIGPDEPDLLRAARVGLGSLGVIAAVTLRCVPAFRLRRVDRPRPLDEVLGELDTLVRAHDHFEFYVFPHTDVALVRESERVEDAPDPGGRVGTFLQETLLENWVLEILSRAARLRPGTIPALNRFIVSQMSDRVKLESSHHVFATERLVRFTEMEYAIPIEHAAQAVREVLDLIPREGLEVSFPIEVRFAGADEDSLLSTAAGRDTCYVAVHMYRGMRWQRYFSAVETVMRRLDGRPHWGKRHLRRAADLAPLYPGWDEFARVRAGLDPDGVFVNPYTRRVLGARAGVRAAATA